MLLIIRNIITRFSISYTVNQAQHRPCIDTSTHRKAGLLFGSKNENCVSRCRVVYRLCFKYSRACLSFDGIKLQAVPTRTKIFPVKQGVFPVKQKGEWWFFSERV